MAGEHQPPARGLDHADLEPTFRTSGAATSETAGWPVRRTTRRFFTVALVGAVVVMLGSCSYRTRWESTELRNGQVRSTGTATDGIGRWSYLTFPLGSLALGLLMAIQLLTRRQPRMAAHRGRGISAAIAILAAACLAAASALANTYWQPLLTEQGAGATFTSTSTMRLAYIAWGLPIVTIAGAIGAAVCIVFAGVLSRANDQDSSR